MDAIKKFDKTYDRLLKFAQVIFVPGSLQIKK